MRSPLRCIHGNGLQQHLAVSSDSMTFVTKQPKFTHPHHTQTPSAMEPYGVSFGHTNQHHIELSAAFSGMSQAKFFVAIVLCQGNVAASHANRTPRPQNLEPYEALWCLVRYHTPYVETTPSLRALWCLVLFHLAIQTTRTDHTQTPRV